MAYSQYIINIDVYGYINVHINMIFQINNKKNINEIDILFILDIYLNLHIRHYKLPKKSFKI